MLGALSLGRLFSPEVCHRLASITSAPANCYKCYATPVSTSKPRHSCRLERHKAWRQAVWMPQSAIGVDPKHATTTVQ